MQEFWDNSQEHKDDIINFAEGRKTPSSYAKGQYVYWIASYEAEPFAMLMTVQETSASPINQEKLRWLSRTGNTYNLEFMIGNPSFLGKGYGARTLSEFIDYFRKSIDPKAETFLIDPASDNPRAKHVYMKAGFEHICDFMMKGNVSSTGLLHHLLVKKFEPKISIITATIDDYPLIQNMFMIYQENVGLFPPIGQCRKMDFMRALILKIILQNN